MRCDGRDRRHFCSALSEPINQANKVCSQPDAIPALRISQDAVDVRVDDHHLARLGFGKFAMVADRSPWTQTADQSEIAHVDNSRRLARPGFRTALDPRCLERRVAGGIGSERFVCFLAR